ncbi:MAG: outer membrane lipoprotein-sorting protein [Proteobacteria bacterium]|nr:MAG: outer membrane lipoprotein-sorting protein [Pseudomonadota bacterium]
MKSQALRLALGVTLFLSGFQSIASAADDPKSLLEQSDRARGGSKKGVSWTVKLDTTEDGDKSSTTYKVKGQGNNAHVEVVEPARSKGEVLLFNDRTIWFFKPSLKKPVAISARQKLSGQAANGDIASTNYARDYTGKIVAEEKVGGEDCYVLELKSVGENTTYDAIKYWISKKKKLGLKADFLSLQGKVLKSAEFTYGNSLSSEGKKFDFVSEMKITDAQNKSNFSVMTYSSPKVESVSASLFNVNNLLR